VLWLDEIQDAVLRANQDTEEALQCNAHFLFTRNPRASSWTSRVKVKRRMGLRSYSFVFAPAVSQSIQAVNEAVDAGEAAQTLAALRNPGAALYGVTSECASTYQHDLSTVKDGKKSEGEELWDG